MTRKDYVALAAAFATVETHSDVQDDTWNALRDAVSEVLEVDNPRFDRGRFNAATMSAAPSGQWAGRTR